MTWAKEKSTHLSKKECIRTTSAQTEKVPKRFSSHLIKYWKLARWPILKFISPHMFPSWLIMRSWVKLTKKLRKLDNLSKNTKTFKCSNGCVHTSLISLGEAYLKKADRKADKKADRKIKITLDWPTHGLQYIISDLVSRQTTVLLLTWTYFRIHFFVALQLLNDGFENIGQRWIVINSKVDSSRFFLKKMKEHECQWITLLVFMIMVATCIVYLVWQFSLKSAVRRFTRKGRVT